MSIRRKLVVAALPAALLAGPLAGAAYAETPAPAFDIARSTPVAGGAGTLTFTPSGASPVTQVDVALSHDAPLLGVTVPTKAGWDAATTTYVTPSCGDKAVDHVTWTASGAPGAAADGFALNVGRFPAAADQITYTGTVTHADGTVEPFSATAGALGSSVAVRAEAPAPVAPAPTSWMTRLVTLVTSVV
jgi:hypothetical protein